MGVVTGNTVFDYPLSCPVRDALAVRPSNPIPTFSKMAPAAHLVTVIHIYSRPIFVHQKVTFILLVTRKTGQRFLRAAVFNNDITMGRFGGPGNLDFLIIMTTTAPKPFHLVFAGFRPELPPWMFDHHRHGIVHNLQGRLENLLIVERGVRIFYGLKNTVIGGVGLTYREDEKHEGGRHIKAFFNHRCPHKITFFSRFGLSSESLRR